MSWVSRSRVTASVGSNARRNACASLRSSSSRSLRDILVLRPTRWRFKCFSQKFTCSLFFPFSVMWRTGATLGAGVFQRDALPAFRQRIGSSNGADQGAAQYYWPMHAIPAGFGADVNRKTFPSWHGPMLPATVPVRVSSLSSGGTGLIPEMSKDYPKSTGEIEMLRVGMWASDHRDGFTAAPLSPSQTPIHCPKTQSQKYQSCRSEVDHRSLPHRAVNYADLLDAR